LRKSRKRFEDAGVIVVATDGSEQARAAMRMAVDLAASTGDEILLVVVWKELRGMLGIGVGGETEREWATGVAAETAALTKKVGVEPEVVIRHGHAGEEICAVARERDARLVVVGSSGHGRFAGAVLGSVSDYVLAHAPCPVVVVRVPSVPA
jgi:nucleotide-binding universal stress UspA family protein